MMTCPHPTRLLLTTPRPFAGGKTANAVSATGATLPTGTTSCGSSRRARVARCPVEVAAGDTTVTIKDTAVAAEVAVAAGTDTTTTAGIRPTECTRPTARSTRPGWPRAAPWLVSTGGHSTRHHRGRNITTTRTQTRHSGTHRAIGPSRGCPNVERVWAILTTFFTLKFNFT